MKFTALVLLPLILGLSSGQTIVDIVSASANHTILESAVLAAPSFIAELLSNETASLTLFAPDDTAFGNLIETVTQSYFDGLLTTEWENHLTCFLTSHVLGVAVSSTDITESTTVASLSGYNLTVAPVDGTVLVNDIPVTAADIQAVNGVIHVISDLPLLPPCVSQSIADQAAGNSDLSTLVSLVEAAGLLDTIGTASPLTLFAPTNDAFAKVPRAILDYLGANVTALTEVLTYHVIESANEFFNGTTTNDGIFSTLLGDEITVKTEGETISLNDDVIILSADNLASNGVVHVIDSVLIPPSLVLPADVTGGNAPTVAPSPTATTKPTSSAHSQTVTIACVTTAMAAAITVVLV